jgi:hypothetical protein
VRKDVVGSGWTVTTEPEHTHWCDVCQSPWSHADEGCEGPRIGKFNTAGGFECPLCEENEL